MKPNLQYIFLRRKSKWSGCYSTPLGYLPPVEFTFINAQKLNPSFGFNEFFERYLRPS